MRTCQLCPFQSIVESYGIARYKEINPTCFSVITFPFLFGVMYGDIGHGVMITALALFFIMKEKELSNGSLHEIVQIVFGGRYVLILMGLFAIYLGFLYNDFFGMIIAPFGSPFWIFPEDDIQALEKCDPGSVVLHGSNASITRGCKRLGGSPYIFGVDSEWAESENKLEFMNGLKMKMAVILGVGQMMWGLVLQLLNHLFYMSTSKDKGERDKARHHVWFGWIPEVIFLGCTFGYMCLMILIKSMVDWPARMDTNLSPPSLLETMTNLFLAPVSVMPTKYLYGSDSAQNGFQSFLLLLAFFAVPAMLLPITILEYLHHKSSSYGELNEPEHEVLPDHAGETSGEGSTKPDQPVAHEDDFDMSEVVIKQVIHTIEFVLGCVSNTAS